MKQIYIQYIIFILKPMYISKQTARLQPIKKSSLNHNNNRASQLSKRAISLKPIMIANNHILKLGCIKDDVYINNKKSKNQKKNIKQSKQQHGKAFDNMILRRPECKSRTTSINSILNRKQGMTSRQMYQRKQSNLNTYFNIRMKKLKDITQQNKRIYQRLNSQKSLYSSKHLNQSFESNNNLSRRLSQSKLSKVSSMRSVSVKHNNTKKSLKNKDNKVTRPIKIESHSIKNVGEGEVQRYLQIFCNNNVNKQTFSKKNIIVQSYNKNTKNDKQNNGFPFKHSLQGIIQQFKVKSKAKNQINLARLL